MDFKQKNLAGLAGTVYGIELDSAGIIYAAWKKDTKCGVAKWDTALIQVDAYLQRTFKGVVTEIANSASVAGVSAGGERGLPSCGKRFSGDFRCCAGPTGDRLRLHQTRGRD